jgi:DNA-binding response OmpR family regulator
MPKTILCIDDDRRVFSELLAGLENDDHRLLYTDDLDEALQIAVDGQLDLIMMEILLSQGDGLDWVEEIRATGNGRSKIPIVIVTAADRTPKLYGRAVELGVADYLTKPVLQSQLIACVREVADAEDVLAPLDIAEPTAAADFDHSELDLIELDDPELDLPDKGKLAEFPLPEVLDRLHHAARTGVLVVEGRRGR